MSSPTAQSVLDNKITETKILSIHWNQDFTCFACGTENGFHVFNTDPMKSRFARDLGKGVGAVEMLFRCNLLALIGGGQSPKFSEEKAIIWDDYQNKSIGELEFRSPVKTVKLRKDKIVVVLESRVYIYSFSDLQVITQMDTCANPKGLCAVTPSNDFILAVPGKDEGVISIVTTDEKNAVKTLAIQAHKNAITCLALNRDGTRLATASDRGTLVRIFDTSTGTKLKEVRRGTEQTEILSIAFSQNSSWIAVSSNKGSVHIWGLAASMQQSNNTSAEQGKEEDKTKSFAVPFVKALMPQYFSSEWSFAQFHLPETHAIVCFSQDNQVVAVCRSGMYYKYSFDTDKGGECKREVAVKFMDPKAN